MKKFHIIPVCAALTLILTCSLTPVAPCGETFLQSLQGWRIFIDPGTGNELSKIPFVEKTKDKNDVTEADINMRVALFLADFFKKAGAEILLSREPAQPLPKLDERLKKADEFKANLIISIHHDRVKDPRVNYVNAYYHPSGKEPNTSIARNIVASLGKDLNLPVHGPDTFPYPLLTMTTMPAVMVNCGFLSNPDLAKNLNSLEYNRSEAIAILKGMLAFQEELSKTQTAKPPLVIPETKVRPMSPLPPMNIPPPPAPQPSPVAQVTVPIPAPPTPLPAAQPTESFNPPLQNPADAPIDQTWLFGESHAQLPPRKGIAFKAKEGAIIKSAADGTVVEASDTSPPAAPQYPNCVIIRHTGLGAPYIMLYTFYGRLATISVKKGDNVKRGDPIGTCGSNFSITGANRDKDFEFQVRWGNINESCIVNPELFLKPLTTNTGIIIGRIVNDAGEPLTATRINGIKKQGEISNYGYSITYAPGFNASELYNENFVIGDVTAGQYTLTTQYGSRNVIVEPGKITRLEWK